MGQYFVVSRSITYKNVKAIYKEMNFVNCRHLLAVFVYCGTVLPVIVSGQPTTDSNAIVDPRDEIVSNLIDRITKLEGYLVSSVDEISKLKGSVCWTSVITFLI